MPTIETRYERERGCGFRKGGGLYLVSGFEAAPCGRLPIPLAVCPCCSQGIKPARGWTWIEPAPLVEGIECGHPDVMQCLLCPLGLRNLPDRAGLLWIGGKFYKTPASFSAEAAQMGVSRRITAIPRDFKLGETWVLLAHREVPGVGEDDQPGPAIFSAFKPTAVEYVVKGDETEEELERLEERGITLVDVTPIAEEAGQEELAVN